MSKVKFTDEELSRILGQFDIGELDDHMNYGSCVAGAAYNLGRNVMPMFNLNTEDMLRCDILSAKVAPIYSNPYNWKKYPAINVDEMLEYLEKRGVA